MNPSALRCPCRGGRFSIAHVYERPPKGETRFASPLEPYHREIHRCENCGHFVSLHNMDLSAFYEGPYVDASYGDDGIERAFERITSLEPSKSDNEGRVRRVLAYAADHFRDGSHRSILDVGSGIGVFCHRMKAAGWQCTALDPDPRAANHAAENVGVQSVCGDFMNIENLGCFDVVAFNKVLEHVRDPVAMLARALNHLSSKGFVYIELPDGEEASHEGYLREEFFIEHYHIFSRVSAALIAERAGFAPASVERLREPSNKYTLRAFLVPARKVQS